MPSNDVDDRLPRVGESVGTLMRATQILLIAPSDREALRLLAAGHSKDVVAVGLGISTREMETQLAELFAAMGAATQAEAIVAAQRRGLLA